MSVFVDKSRVRLYLIVTVCILILFMYHKTYGGGGTVEPTSREANNDSNLDFISQQYRNLINMVKSINKTSDEYHNALSDEEVNALIQGAQPVVTKCSPDQRRDFVRRQCQLLNYYSPDSIEYTRKSIFEMTPLERKQYTGNLLVDDKHKLLFCSNAKVGATTYKYLLLAHADGMTKNAETGKPDISMGAIHGDNYLEKYNLTCGGKFSDEEMLFRLRNYRKVMTVRDPLLRVYSSYREKLATVKPPECQMYQRGLGTKILQRYRGNLTAEQEKCGYDVTPAEFMRYLANDEDAHRILKGDPHWNRYHLKCKPCVIDYDYYIRIETGDTDQAYFLNEYMHSEDAASYGGDNVRFNNVGKTSEQLLQENGYEQLSDGYKGVDPQDFAKIEEHYRIDSILFGYKQTLSPQGMTSTCRSTDSSDNHQCC